MEEDDIMIGAIIGDLIGAKYEFKDKVENIEFESENNRLTDDSIMTVAIADALSKHYPFDYTQEKINLFQKDLIKIMKDYYKKYPNCGYGNYFKKWLSNEVKQEPYNSYGNGAAMRISPVGWISKSVEEVKALSKTVTEITHNHSEGLKGAEAIAMCIFLARKGKSKEEIRKVMITEYYPEIEYMSILSNKENNVTCQVTCPQAIYCFLIASSYEDTIKKAISIGKDTDTLACMATSIAEAYYFNDKISEFEKKIVGQYVPIDLLKPIEKIYLYSNSKKNITSLLK